MRKPKVYKAMDPTTIAYGAWICFIPTVGYWWMLTWREAVECALHGGEGCTSSFVRANAKRIIARQNLRLYGNVGEL